MYMFSTYTFWLIIFLITEGVVMNFWKKVPLDSCFRRPKAALTSSGYVSRQHWLKLCINLTLTRSKYVSRTTMTSSEYLSLLVDWHDFFLILTTILNAVLTTSILKIHLICYPSVWEEALGKCCLRPRAEGNSFPGLLPIQRDNWLTVP